MSGSANTRRSELNRQIQSMKFAKVVAEPLPRQSPAGVTSGISQRVVGAVGAEAIRRICRHYVDKCSGRYAKNVMAARYVHQMADEVLIQLEALRDPSASTPTPVSQPSLSSRMEELLNEWNEHFPSSLGRIGSPKVVAAKLKTLEKEMSSLKDQLQTQRVTHEGTVAELHHQLKVSRAGILVERQSIGEEMARKESQLREAFEEERKRWEGLLNAAESAAKERFQQLESELRVRVRQAESETAGLREQVDRLREQNKRLQEKHKARRTAVRALEALSLGDQLKPAHIEAIEGLNQRVVFDDSNLPSRSSPVTSPSVSPSTSPMRKSFRLPEISPEVRAQERKRMDEYNTKIKSLQKQIDDMMETSKRESLKNSSLEAAYVECFAQLEFLEK